MNVIGIGAGGHAKVVLDVLAQLQYRSVVGLVDADPALWGSALLGVPVLGGDEDLDKLIVAEKIAAFFVGIGAVKSLALRRKAYEFALGKGLVPLNVLHPSAQISRHATLGSGLTMMVASIVNAGSRIGDNVIINTGAIVEHDCAIGNHVHVATGACVSGGVEIGDESMIGAGAVIRQYLRIGRRAVVGAGAVVIRDVPDGCTVVGNPAKIMTGSSA